MKRKAKRIAIRPTVPIKNHSIQKGFGHEIPPDKGLVEIYFDQKGHLPQALQFYEHYDNNGWRSAQGTTFKNWKVLASDWIFNNEQAAKLRTRIRYNKIISGDM